jgi:hypothetical protein
MAMAYILHAIRILLSLDAQATKAVLSFQILDAG